MDYLDFELTIEAGNGSTYPVAVIRSPAGEAHATMPFPFDEQALANQLLTVHQALTSSDGTTPQIHASRKQSVEHFGQALFQALFTGEIGNLYAVSQSTASSQGKGLRLKLHLQPPELAVLPWEFLYDPGRGKYLCLSDYTPVVRYLELPAPPQPLSITPPLCILGMVASPKGLPALDVEREKQRLETALADLVAKGLMQLTWLPGRTWKDLQQAMSAGPWHIFHFIGHGGVHPDTNEGIIALEDEAGQADYLSATQLGMLLTDHRFLRLVVLNSCDGARGSSHESFSSTATTLVREGIPAVLANQYAISDEAAMALSSTFYTALAEGRSVDMAVSEARKAVALEGAQTAEWAVPTLHMHAPDGVLFHLPQVAFQSSYPSGVSASGTAAPSSASLFVSYSRKDQEVVTRLYEDLQRYHLTLWIDHKDILPGSPDWENVIRTALRSSSEVLWVVTPHILNSPYVKDELDIAKLYQRPVYPLWMDGTAWIDCVPLGWGHIQYLDARAERYEMALAQLVQLVQKLPSAPPSLSQPTKQKLPSELPLPSQPTKQESAFAPRNPYKGLDFFTSADARDFFGREQLITDLVDGVKKALGKEQAGGEAARLLAVIGPSGSGKSSVVMAGLLPHLQQNALPGSQQWIYLERMVPGAHPLEELVQTLSYQLPERSHASLLEDLSANSARGLHLLVEHIARPKSTRAVLLIDQFEELFTQTTDVAEREQFLHLLTTAATEPGGSLLIILTLRADFYDRPMQYPALRRLLQEHQVTVGAMESADLRKVIEQPAALLDVQLSLEEDLVGDLLFELRGQVGALPLVEFTLDQLFQRRSERRLTRQAYQEIGGVKGALAKHAESTYADLPSEEHRRLARALFLRLLEPGASEQETTRRRAALSEFTLDDQGQTRLMQETIEIFVKARLLTTTTNESAGTNTIEVSHEALIREWPRLVGWLREAREDIRLQQSISEDAAAWEQHNKPGDRLYRGSQLKEAQAWARRNTPSGGEVAFLHASAASRVRFLVSVIAVVLMVVSSMGGVSWVLTHQPPKAPDPTRVSNLQDNDNPGSLRYAINDALPKSTITFDASLRGGTILLSSGDLNIAKDLTIRGPGAGILSISSGKSGHVVHVVQGVTVTISGLTFKDSTTSKSFIYNEGALMLTNSTISGNKTSSDGGGNGGGIFNSSEGTVTLSNSIISDNTATSTGIGGTGGGIANGGGIFNNGTLTLSNSIVSGNKTSSDGGGIFNSSEGTVTLSNSIISDNTATSTGIGGTGGGIANGGVLTLTNSTISGNSSQCGGGIENGGGDCSSFSAPSTLMLTNSTVSGNKASSDGGGIYNSSSVLTLTNSTVSGNSARDGGGISIHSTLLDGLGSITQVDLTFSTMYGNTAQGGGDIAIEDIATSSNGNGTFSSKPIEQISQVKISNTIVAGDPAHPGPDMVGMLTSYGYNLFQDNSGATFDPATRTQHGTDKTLSVNDLPTLFADPVRLQDNGGRTRTYALAPGSPVLDQIPLGACHVTVPSIPIPSMNFFGTPIAHVQYTITTDQRGMKRPDDGEDKCDIGAYEYVDAAT